MNDHKTTKFKIVFKGMILPGQNLFSLVNLTQLKTQDHQKLNLVPPSGQNFPRTKSIFLILSYSFGTKMIKTSRQ